jgi:hypothetical protein
MSGCASDKPTNEKAPAAASDLHEVASALDVPVSTTVRPSGARSERVRSGSRTPSLASHESRTSAALEPGTPPLVHPPAGGPGPAGAGTADLTILAGIRSPPSKRTRAQAGQQSPSEEAPTLDRGFLAGDDEDLEESDDVSIEDNAEKTLQRLRFKTPASIRKRVKAARESVLSCPEEEYREASVGYADARIDEVRSNLATVRSELRDFRRETVGRLDSMAALLREIKELSSTAAQAQAPVAVRLQWEEALRIPWGTETDVRLVETNRQLQKTLEQYCARFIDSFPRFEKSYIDCLFTRELASHFLQPGSTPKVVWGLLYEPLPEFVTRVYRATIRDRPELAGQSASLQVALVHRFGRLRGERRDRQQDRLVQWAQKDSSVTENQRNAARIVLLDGREGMGLITSPLGDDDDEATRFVRDFGKKVLHQLQVLYPVPAEHDKAIAEAIQPFKRREATELEKE